MSTTEQENAAFEAMTAAEKRVAIAKDAIEQIGERYVVGRGVYMAALTKRHLDGSAVDFARDPETRCRVCARGALFLSGLRLFNSYDEPLRTYVDTDQEERFFGAGQVRLIECAFEGWDRERAGDEYAYSIRMENAPPIEEFYPTELEDAILHYREAFPRDTDRLLAILENIIANNGTFVP